MDYTGCLFVHNKDRTPQMRYEISSAIFQERETAASMAFTQFEAVADRVKVGNLLIISN